MFDYTSNIRSRKAIPCTPEMFDIVVGSTKVSQVCAEIADYREKKLRGEMSREDFETKKSELKRQLPAFLFHAHYSDGHRSNASAIPSGLSIYDLDHINDPRGRWQQIAPRAKELGIVLAHISPSGEGLRIVFILPDGMDLANGQKWLSKQLGDTTFDEACKDMARCSFAVPADYILFIDKENLFADHSKNYNVQSSNKIDNETRTDNSVHPADDNDSERHAPQSQGGDELPQPTARNLRAFDETVKAAHLTLADLNAIGTRHNSLVTILSVGINRLMPKEQLMAVIAVRMPEFSKEPDCRQLIDDWYQKYTEPNKPMSARLQKIFTDTVHTTLSDSPVRGSEGATGINSDDIDLDPDPIEPQADNSKDKRKLSLGNQTSSPLGRLGEELRLARLPIGLNESLANIPPSMQMAVLFYILPLLGAYADGVTVKYCDGREQQLGLISIVVGPQASGKSVCKDVNDRWLKQMLESDMRNREIEEKWREQRRCRKANERAQEDPHVPVLCVPATSSMSNDLRRAKNAQGHSLYTACEELDTVNRTFRRSGGYMVGSDYHRIAWDCGMFGQDYNSDNAESGMVRLRHNFSYMGTFGALKRFLRGDNVENGLSSRIMIAEMPDNSFAPMPTFKTPSAKDDAAIDAAVTKLRSAHGFIDTPRLRKAIGEWVEEKRLQAMANADFVMDTYRKRSAVIGFRCGVIYRILEGKETKSCLRFATMIAEYVLQEQCKIFGDKLRNEYVQANIESSYITENNSIFDSLPAVFTRDDLKAMKGQDVTNSALKMIIHRWKSSGWITKIGINCWQKEKVTK